MSETKIINFHKYCPKCVYIHRSEEEDPCRECLTYGGRDDGSHLPIRFKKKGVEETKNHHYERKYAKSRKKPSI